MGALGGKLPKGLIALAGKPLIERQVAALVGGKVNEIGIVRGYRADMLTLSDVTYFHNPRWAETNMVMSLATASEWLRTKPTIVSYADIFYRRELVRGLALSTGDIVIAYDRAWQSLWRRRFRDPLSDAETFRADDSGKLIEIGGKTQHIGEISGQYMGLLKITPTGWQIVQDLLLRQDPELRDRLDMTALLRLLLIQGFTIDTFATAGQWGEVDSLDDLMLYETMVRDGELLLEG
jgi:L-glutamine-phosphate cytidylyltransferase